MAEEELKTLMNTMFLGYKYRKLHGMLYSVDATVPLSLIKMYYSQKFDRLDVGELNKNFVERYVRNESILEGVHDKEEIKGLEVMYDEMHQMNDNEFELFSIIQLHRALYSKTEHPEFGGQFRTASARLNQCQIDTSDPDNIFMDMIALEDVVNYLKVFAVQMKYTNDYSNIKEFVKECMKLKCKLLQVHPFGDGNGRTVRCFINKLFQMAGIPPVYISKNEKEEYKTAVMEAQRYRAAGEIDDDSKYDLITGFYLYKICDSIIELDINKSVRQEKKEKNFDPKKTKKKV